MQTTETQKALVRALKEIDEQLALSKKKSMTGLQKWQLAVKFLSMN